MGDGESRTRLLRRISPLIIAVQIFFSLFAAGHAAGATVRVAPGEKIQAAIDEAGEGDEVMVESGVYPQTASIYNDYRSSLPLFAP